MVKQSLLVDSFSLYIHIPYCVRKCPYCDFNSYAIEDTFLQDEKAYSKALLKELDYYSSEFASYKLRSIFFGGGTPSLFSEHSIKTLLEGISRYFTLCPEITLEANPATLAEGCSLRKLEAFSQSGISRVSLGSQSFLPSKLKMLGRVHQAEDTASSIERLTQAGISNLNIDLIFGLVGETVSDWEQELETAIQLNTQHVSLYGLTIEPGTEFGRRAKKGELLTAEEEVCGSMYRKAIEVLHDAGLEQYEISNFARSGFECQHNLGYWSGQPYLGIGAGAHSFHNNQRWANIPGPRHYIQRCHAQGEAKQFSETLSRQNLQQEFFLLGLRRIAGISKSEYQELFGENFDVRFGSLLRSLEKEKLVYQENSHIRLTQQGLLFSNSVIEQFASRI